MVVERQCEIANVVAVRALSVVVADQQRGGWSGPRVIDDNTLTRHVGCVRERRDRVVSTLVVPLLVVDGRTLQEC